MPEATDNNATTATATSIFSAGSQVDRVAPFTALAVRDWLQKLRESVDLGDRDKVVLSQRMLVGFVKNLRLLGFDLAADALAVDVGKMVSELKLGGTRSPVRGKYRSPPYLRLHRRVRCSAKAMARVPP